MDNLDWDSEDLVSLSALSAIKKIAWKPTVYDAVCADVGSARSRRKSGQSALSRWLLLPTAGRQLDLGSRARGRRRLSASIFFSESSPLAAGAFFALNHLFLSSYFVKCTLDINIHSLGMRKLTIWAL